MKLPEPCWYEGKDGARLAADSIGAGPPVLLLHGGGQTRGSWRRAAQALAARGYHAVALDARGHGDSDWATDGYGFDVFAGDLRAVIDQVGGRPALVGASLGGLTALMALGMAERPIASALVLVDITTRIEPRGVEAIHAFMTANPDGFASVEEAADAVARYMTDRPRPANIAGLRRNLRERADGRLHWHWDPDFLTGGGRERPDPNSMMESFEAAARRVSIPTLLVRGEHSNIVSDAGVGRLRELIPAAEIAEVRGAGHMVAGDANTPFADAMIGFLERVYPV
ncbi:alpha/beta fold hydrolase [Flavisphingomonas formosensis]|uniref:alpha/beta fold hydrolase n=1 Tax=Flavisphingomonas formosensis TaxID=861534 RepID=UPI0012F7D378|nr:alpha/beta hydrolase [Sphingomonas formosensis]